MTKSNLHLMKILYSILLCSLALLVSPYTVQAQDIDENSQNLSLKVDDVSWQPQLTRAEYLFEKGQSVEMLSISMFRVKEKTITNLMFKIVRFEGVKVYEVGEVNSLIGAYGQRNGTAEGPLYRMVPGSGTVEITAYDAKNLTVSGKFSFEMKDPSSDEIIKVTDGKFKNIKLIDVTPEEGK